MGPPLPAMLSFWRCESCMCESNKETDVRCVMCKNWRSEEVRTKWLEEQRILANATAKEAERQLAQREAEEAARRAVKESQKLTRDERIKVLLGRISNKLKSWALDNWIEMVAEKRLVRLAQQMHEGHIRTGKRFKVGTAEALREVFRSRFIQAEGGEDEASASASAQWQTQPGTYEAKCGKLGVVVDVSATELAVKLQFAGERSLWFPVEAVSLHLSKGEVAPVAMFGGPAVVTVTAPEPKQRQQPEPEPEPEPEQDTARRIRAATLIQTRYRGHQSRRRWAPEIQRARGWSSGEAGLDHGSFLDSIARLEQGTKANFNLDFTASTTAADPASLPWRVDWQAAVGEGPAWTITAVHRYVQQNLSRAMRLSLGADELHHDGVRRSRMAPDDVEALLTCIREEVKDRKTPGPSREQVLRQRALDAAAGNART